MTRLRSKLARINSFAWPRRTRRRRRTLRCVVVALLHNAFKAPAAQFFMYVVLAALYARTRVLKMTGKKGYYREEKTE